MEQETTYTIDQSHVSGSSDLTDFPFLVTLDHLNAEVVDGGTNSALNGGGDIRFSSDSEGNNRLAVEIVEFVTDASPTNRKCQIWVKIPNLSATSNTTIYIWYNKAGEVQPATSDTYGSQSVWTNYVFVSHDCLTDSSGNKTITQTVAASTASSVFDGTTAYFDGVNDRHTVDISDWDLSLGQTITFWASYNDSSVYKRMVNLINSTGVVQFIKGDGLANNTDIVFFSSTDNTNQSPGSESFSADLGSQNQWFFFKGSTTNLNTGRNLKVNAQDYTSVPNNQIWTPGTIDNNMTIGARGGNQNHFNGRIASLMVSFSQLSDAYITTMYNNQNNPSTFASVGVPNEALPPSTPDLSSTGQSSTTVNLSWIASTDNVAVTGYNIYKDGSLENTLGNILTYQVTGLTASTSYDFSVTALDAASNESAMSNTVNVTTDAPSSGGTSGYWNINNQDVYYSVGNVGIGTSAPDEKLTVKGTVHSEEVKVDLSVPAPDYVFKVDYNLTSLEELRGYIKNHGHLPNIPSAKEMEANGVELGIMNMKLLEKIEELTLYILQQQNQLDVQNNEREKLKNRLINLEKLIENNKE